MFKRHHLVRSTLTVAMLSAAFLSASAHAGLLGGGGAVGLGGGLSGGISPRGLDVNGSASGQINRNAAPLPRPATVVNKVGETGQKVDAAARQSATGAATVGANAAATGANAAATGQAAAGQATTAGSTGAAAAGQSATSAATAPRSGTATLDGAARASRSNGSLAGDVSAQGAVSR